MDAFVRDFADVLEDPFDPGTSKSVNDSGLRSAAFGGLGIVEFLPWPELDRVVVHRILWFG